MQASGSCQDDEGFQCGGGQFPCLPHWKFDDDLKNVIGSGAKKHQRRFDVILTKHLWGDHGGEMGYITIYIYIYMLSPIYIYTLILQPTIMGYIGSLISINDCFSLDGILLVCVLSW